MAATTVFTCVCGVQKRNTNHWILAKVNSTSIQFLPWDWDLARGDDVIVLCGEGCAAALLSRSLGEWKHLPAGIPRLSSRDVEDRTRVGVS